MTRYAEGTSVSVATSRGEITGILAKHGVERQGWQTGPLGDELMFELGGRGYRFSIVKPIMSEIVRDYPNARDFEAKLAGEWRRRWRANVLLLKAKLEFADGETTTVERELLPYLVTVGGGTLAEWVEANATKLLGVGS